MAELGPSVPAPFLETIKSWEDVKPPFLGSPVARKLGRAITAHVLPDDVTQVGTYPI